MVRREIEIDEETDRILTQLAQDYEGDMGKALAGLVHARENNEDFLDLQEELQREALTKQVERSEREYREGNFTTWDEVKRRNGL